MFGPLINTLYQLIRHKACKNLREKPVTVTVVWETLTGCKKRLVFFWELNSTFVIPLRNSSTEYETGSEGGHGIDHVLQNFFMWPFLTSRFDHVYYGNCLEDTKSDMDLEPLFQFVAAPIDQRSTPAEQVRSKEAYGIIKKWANDPNGFIICCDQKKWHANIHPALSSTHCGNVVASTMWQ